MVVYYMWCLNLAELQRAMIIVQLYTPGGTMITVGDLHTKESRSSQLLKVMVLVPGATRGHMPHMVGSFTQMPAAQLKARKLIAKTSLVAV